MRHLIYITDTELFTLLAQALNVKRGKYLKMSKRECG